MFISQNLLPMPDRYIPLLTECKGLGQLGVGILFLGSGLGIKAYGFFRRQHVIIPMITMDAGGFYMSIRSCLLKEGIKQVGPTIMGAGLPLYLQRCKILS